MTEYIIPVKIIIQSGIQNADRLLNDAPRQAILGNENTAKIEKGGYVVLDFGKEIQGGIHYVTQLVTENSKMRIVFGESVMEALSSVGEKNATNDHAIRDMIVNVTSWSSQRAGNTGFRFVRVEAVEGDIELGCVQAAAEYRDLKYRGEFESDDELLNEIWRVGAYTVHLNMQEYIWDGIKRDRLVWIGDMHPEMSTIKYVFGDNEAVTKSLDLIRNSTSPEDWMNGMPTYTMWWIKIQRDWYFYTGNKKYLDEQKDYIIKAVKHILSCINDDGTNNIENKFVDWSSHETPEADAGLWAMITISLGAAAELLNFFGENGLSSECKKIIEKEKNLCYEYKNNKQIAALVSLAGLGDKEKIRNEILLKDGSKGLSAFLGYYTLQAIANAGEIDDAFRIIKDYWGKMLEFGATTFWEDFDVDWTDNAVGIDKIVPEGKKDIHGDFGKYCYKNFRHSLCHGWASGPTAFLSEYVLGVENLEPGFKKIRIKPHMGNLSYVRGVVPTVYGDIRVLHKKNGDKIVSEVSVPEGIEICE